MKYISQPAHSKICGQTCLAMVTGDSVSEIRSYLKKYQGTRNPDIKRYLRAKCFDIEFRINSKPGNIPNNSIVKIGYVGSPNTHWVVKHEGLFYDPVIGIVKEYNWEFIQPISYIYYEN